MTMVNVAKTPQVARARVGLGGGWDGGVFAQLDRLRVAAPQRGAAVVEEGHADTCHASLKGRGERACCQHSCTSAASVLLLAPDHKGRRGQPLLQREGVALLLQTGVRGTMVGVQARVRLGRKK